MYVYNIYYIRISILYVFHTENENNFKCLKNKHNFILLFYGCVYAISVLCILSGYITWWNTRSKMCIIDFIYVIYTYVFIINKLMPKKLLILKKKNDTQSHRAIDKTD